MPFFNQRYSHLADPTAIELSTLSNTHYTPHEHEQYDTAQTTRIISLAGLVASIISGITCVIVGSGVVTKHMKAPPVDDPYGTIMHSWPDTGLHNLTAEFIPLLVTVIITQVVLLSCFILYSQLLISIAQY
jgi:hypothetical protein